MDYQLEQLGSDRFQDLVQAMLVREMPGVQCFPVSGMADGGRDATARLPVDGEGFAVFQVKFVARPQSIRDPHKWVLKALRGEAQKVKRLVERGASSYFLVTNVGGTGQLDRGSIDQANSIVGDLLDEIPFMVWWRTDVNRRLDTSMDLKWLYPEIMTGQDALRVLLESGDRKAAERVERVARAYLRDQYSADKEVRFRQAELQSSLMELYVDVPIVADDQPRRGVGRMRNLHRVIRTLRASDRDELDDPEIPSSRLTVGAATLLLSSAVDHLIPWVVLEGAPGQGKSTVVQYLCQVHRMRLLDERQAVRKLNKPHRQTPLRFPIKFEARDLAAWLTDPEAPEDPSDPRTLESFIARQIHLSAGGLAFDVADLIDLATSQPILIVIDGLDEVANFQSRRAVVRQATSGFERLQENAQSLQIVITTRPAAFSNTPGFSRDIFDYLYLGDLSVGEVSDYSSRWAEARNLPADESSEVRQILMSRLEQPHLRDLARNPMQLAILLNLIVARGSSLPDQRTALYDAYIDVFLDREAEKSEIVRDHRQTLLNLHQFLGWLLHAQAEEGSDGRISLENLKSSIRDFLSAEDHDPALADDLMVGAVDRVVALVSRVEGTYEFEVQPLREYFAARFLYDTAPYSPAGTDVGGTKPDRFAGLARSPYWLNVARFFAGCYDRGELPSLADQLERLSQEPPYRESGHASQLAWLLLSDQVFSQDRHVVKRVVQILTQGRLLFQVVGDVHTTRSSALPPGNGRREVFAYALSELDSVRHWDVASRLAQLAAANADRQELLDAWEEKFRSLQSPDDRMRWVQIAMLPGVLRHSAHPGDWAGGWVDTFPSSELPALLLVTGQHDRGDVSEQVAREVLNLALAGGQTHWIRFDGPVDIAAEMLGLWTATIGRRTFESKPFDMNEVSGFYLTRAENIAVTDFKTAAFRECSDLARTFVNLASGPLTEWESGRSQLTIASTAHQMWGDVWLVLRFGVLLANAADGLSEVTEDPLLVDAGVPIVDRVAQVHRRRDNPGWWERQLGAALSSDDDMTFVLASLVSWATGNVFRSLRDTLIASIESLSSIGYQRVVEAVSFKLMTLEQNRPLRLSDEFILSVPSTKARVLLAHRAKNNQRAAVEEIVLADPDELDPIVARLVYHRLFSRDVIQRFGWAKMIGVGRILYESGRSAEDLFGRPADHVPVAMPLDIAEGVWSGWDELPIGFVEAAQAAFRWQSVQDVPSVGSLATSQRWFSDRYSYADTQRS